MEMGKVLQDSVLRLAKEPLIKTWNKYPYRCPHCKQTFKQKDVVVHVLLYIRSVVQHCGRCINGFTAEKFLNQHMGKHVKDIVQQLTDINDITCSFKNSTRLNQLRTSQFGQFKCGLCHQHFKTRNVLSDHMINHIMVAKISAVDNNAFGDNIRLQEQQLKKNWYHCRICDRPYVTLKGLRNHEVVHKTSMRSEPYIVRQGSPPLHRKTSSSNESQQNDSISEQHESSVREPPKLTPRSVTISATTNHASSNVPRFALPYWDFSEKDTNPESEPIEICHGEFTLKISDINSNSVPVESSAIFPLTQVNASRKSNGAVIDLTEDDPMKIQSTVIEKVTLALNTKVVMSRQDSIETVVYSDNENQATEGMVGALDNKTGNSDGEENRKWIKSAEAASLAPKKKSVSDPKTESHDSTLQKGRLALICGGCSFTCKDNSELSLHITDYVSMTYGKNKQYRCSCCRNNNCPKARSERYACRYCGLLYGLSQHVKSHIRNNHPDEPAYTCTICNEGYNSRYWLRTHMVQHKLEDQSTLSCNLCGKGLRGRVERQTQVHIGNGPKKPNVQKSGLEEPNHQKSDPRDPNLNKEETEITVKELKLERESSDESTFSNNHEQTETDDALNTENQQSESNLEYQLMEPEAARNYWNCQVKVEEGREMADQESTNTNLNQNEMTSTNKEYLQTADVKKETYSCEKCGQHFRRKVNLDNHLALHERRKKSGHRCSSCGIVTYGLNRFRVHIERHHPEKIPLFCTNCGHVAKDVTKFSFHSVECTKVAPGNNQNRCERCNITFLSYKAYNEHQHTDEKPGRAKRQFRCKYCEISFTSFKAYRQHRTTSRHLVHVRKHGLTVQQVVHNPLNPGMPNTNRQQANKHQLAEQSQYSCEQCGLVFYSFKTYNEHYLAEHQPYPCMHCELMFQSASYLNQHIMVHHCNKVELTPESDVADVETQPEVHNPIEEHVTSGQTIEQPIGCDMCGELFPNRYCLDVHKLTNENCLEIQKLTNRSIRGDIIQKQPDQIEIKTEEDASSGYSNTERVDKAKIESAHEEAIDSGQIIKDTEKGLPLESFTVVSDPVNGSQMKLNSQVIRWMNPKPWNHVRSKDTKFPYQCGKCNETFQYEHHLTGHIWRRHKDIHSCSICGCRFMNKSLLDIHIRLHEPSVGRPDVNFQANKEPTEIQSKNSPEAGNTVIAYEPEEHVVSNGYSITKRVNEITGKSTHEEMKDIGKMIKVTEIRPWNGNIDNETAHSFPYQCGNCSETFEFEEHLNGHLQRIHKIGLNVCTVCGCRFMKKSHLELHRSRVHPLHEPADKLNSTVKYTTINHMDQDMQIEAPQMLVAQNYATNMPIKDSPTHDQPEETHDNFTKYTQLHKCGMCEMEFVSERFLYKHMIIHKRQQEQNPSYKCGTCQMLFISDAILSEHMKVHATEEHSYECHVCGEEYSLEIQLFEHLRTHSGDISISDMSMDDTTSNCQSLDSSINFVPSCKTLPRSLGTLRLSTGSDLGITPNRPSFESPRPKSTNSSLSEELPANDRPYKCIVCGKSYKVERYLLQHVQTHTNSTIQQCDKCWVRFDSRTKLSKHYQMVHSGKEKKFPCEQCDKAFASSYKLKEHIMCHSGARPYECTLCGNTYRTRRYLATHMFKHNEGLSYQCSQCGVGFKTRDRLKSHMLEHKGDLVTVDIKICGKCGRGFMTSQDLSRHNKCHHGNNEVKHICPTCGKTCATFPALSQHMNRHVQDGTAQKRIEIVRLVYQCSKCGVSFDEKDDLINHMPEHGTNSVPSSIKVCDECRRGFLTTLELQLHVKSAHQIEKI